MTPIRTIAIAATGVAALLIVAAVLAVSMGFFNGGAMVETVLAQDTDQPRGCIKGEPCSIFEKGDDRAPGLIQNPSPIPCGGGETVGLIQDNIPWFAAVGQDPLGANVTELKAQGKKFCIVNSVEVPQIGTVALPPFAELIISSAQNQVFYNHLFCVIAITGCGAAGVIHPAINGFVLNGGILSANLTDCASGPGAGGTWATVFCTSTAATSYTFVGGVKHVFAPDQQNNIAAPNHAIIANSLPCPGGNCVRILDGSGFRDDLDGWNADSHGFFINLPAGAKIILVDGHTPPRPVKVQYHHGSGVVIVDMTTTEWRYVGAFGSLPQNKKLTANEIAFQDALWRYEYAAKIICGTQRDPKNTRLARGFYATAINIHNPNNKDVKFKKKLALTFPPDAQRPGRVSHIAIDEMAPDEALEVDCLDIQKRLFPGGLPAPYIKGFVVIQSSDSLDVTAVYTTAALNKQGTKLDGHSSIDVEQIRERIKRPGSHYKISTGGLPDF